MNANRERFESALQARFGDLIDRRVCKNGDGEYMAWDMQVAWWAWQAAGLQTKCPTEMNDGTDNYYS